MVKWIAPALLLLPLLEIGAFVLVAAWLGVGWAFLLMVATSVVGAQVLRRAGRAGLARVRAAARDRDIIDAGAGGLLGVIGGLLLLLPGFITDTIGAVLLVPAVRRGVARLVRTGLARHANGREAVIDLDPDEWRQIPDPKLDRIDRPDRR